MPGKAKLNRVPSAGSSRREELLNAAAALFAERGFASVTVNDIGAATGISGPALYHHFAGKEALLGEMLLSISEHLLEAAGEILTRSNSAQEVLWSLIDAHASFAVERPDLITVHYRDLVSAPEEDRRGVRRLQRRYVEIWVETLAEIRPEAGLRAHRAAVHATLGLLNSTPFAKGPTRSDMQVLLRTMAGRALGLLPPPHRPSPASARSKTPSLTGR